MKHHFHTSPHSSWVRAFWFAVSFAKAGDAIMHQGAVEYSMFIVVSGTADVYVSDAKTEDPLQGCMMMFWDVTGKKGGALKGNDMKRPQVLVNLEN